METDNKTLCLAVITTIHEYLTVNAVPLGIHIPKEIIHVAIKYEPDWSGLKLTHSWLTNDPDPYFCITILYGKDLYRFYTYFISIRNNVLLGIDEWLTALGNIMIGLHKLMRKTYGGYTFTVDFTVNHQITVPMIQIRDETVG
ncbi:MAG: hypothetical protein V4686_02470 [Patescibacteria group bacterium]